MNSQGGFSATGQQREAATGSPCSCESPPQSCRTALGMASWALGTAGDSPLPGVPGQPHLSAHPFPILKCPNGPHKKHGIGVTSNFCLAIPHPGSVEPANHERWHTLALSLISCDLRAKDGFRNFKGLGGEEEVIGSVCGLQSLYSPSGPLQVKSTAGQARPSPSHPARCRGRGGG